MSVLKFRENHQVKTYECDTQSEMTLPSLINVMVETSGKQSEMLGNSENHMTELGLSWIIIQYHMTLNRMPKQMETIIIETEAVSYNRFFTYRIFRAYDAEENLLVEVMTTFSIMKMETRKMTQIPADLVAPYEAEEIRTIIRPPKIEAVGEPTQSIPFRVRYLDIDGNQHVNNSKYFDWMLNTLDRDFHATHQMVDVNIKYEKEVGYGSMINSQMSEEQLEDGTIKTRHEIINNGDICCVANMIWKKREN